MFNPQPIESTLLLSNDLKILWLSSVISKDWIFPFIRQSLKDKNKLTTADWGFTLGLYRWPLIQQRGCPSCHACQFYLKCVKIMIMGNSSPSAHLSTVRYRTQCIHCSFLAEFYGGWGKLMIANLQQVESHPTSKEWLLSYSKWLYSIVRRTLDFWNVVSLNCPENAIHVESFHWLLNSMYNL